MAFERAFDRVIRTAIATDTTVLAVEDGEIKELDPYVLAEQRRRERAARERDEPHG